MSTVTAEQVEALRLAWLDANDVPRSRTVDDYFDRRAWAAVATAYAAYVTARDARRESTV
jgi:hypothetical protein